MAERALQALLVIHLPNVRYLSGFTGSSGALLVTEYSSILFTDGRYRTQARAEANGASVVIGKKAAVIQAADWLDGRTRGRMLLGIESDHLTVAAQSALHRALPSRVKIRSTASLVERLRMIKDADELARIRKAVKLGSDLFKQVVG